MAPPGPRGLSFGPPTRCSSASYSPGATPIILSVAGFRSAELGRISPLWLVAAYVAVTAAEVCISVVALELAFTAAPKSMTSLVTACWLLTMCCGDLTDW